MMQDIKGWREMQKLYSDSSLQRLGNESFL